MGCRCSRSSTLRPPPMRVAQRPLQSSQQPFDPAQTSDAIHLHLSRTQAHSKNRCFAFQAAAAPSDARWGDAFRKHPHGSGECSESSSKMVGSGRCIQFNRVLAGSRRRRERSSGPELLPGRARSRGPRSSATESAALCSMLDLISPALSQTGPLRAMVSARAPTRAASSTR